MSMRTPSQSGCDRLGRRGGIRESRGDRLSRKDHRGLRIGRKEDAVAMGDADLLLVHAHAKQLLADADVVVPAVTVINAELNDALPRPLLTGETEALRPQEDAHRVALRE